MASVLDVLRGLAAEADEVGLAPSILTDVEPLPVRPAASVAEQETACVPSPETGTSPERSVAALLWFVSVTGEPSTVQLSPERLVSLALAWTVGADWKKPLAGVAGVTDTVTVG